MTSGGAPSNRDADDGSVHDLQASLKGVPPLLLLGLALSALGFIGMLFAGFGIFSTLFLLGLLLLVLSIVQYLPRILGREQVIDQWDYLISGAEGKGEGVVEATEQLLAKTRAPDVMVERQAVSPGLLRGLAGGERCFLVIANTKNFNLRPYQFCLNTQNYGISLQVSWYLVQRPSPWYKAMIVALFIPILGLFVLPFYLVLRLAVSRHSGLLGLDIFDEQDLRAYVTNAHHCVLEAVEQLLRDLNQDTSRLQRQSKGFLGIS